MTDEEYVYEVIENEKDARLCAQLIAEEFTVRHPITVFDRISARSFFDDYSWPLLGKVFNEKLSFLARYRSSGEIIGTVVAGDLSLMRENYPYDTSHPPKAIAVSDLYDDMNDIFIRHHFHQELKPNTVLQIHFVAVRSDHTGNGVASRLHGIICDRARDTKGFRYAIVRATNHIVRHIYLKRMNGKELNTIDPAIWRWRKNVDRLSYPYSHYRDESIVNILIELFLEEDNEQTDIL